MELTGKTIFAYCLLIAPFLVLGDSCTSPQVTSSVYTTTEAVSSTETIFIVQFSLTCKNGAKNVNLYADINGKTVEVTRAEEGSKYQYQVSASDDNKNLPAGTYDIKFYDEDGFTSLRKAQRSGEGAANVASLFSIPVNHPGVWKGPILQSEFVAACLAIVVWWFAYTTRSKLESS